VKKTQLNNVTSLRGIAAIFIVIHNYSIYLISDINQFTSTFTPFISKNYIWVDFFFILSGFILAYIYIDKFKNNVEKKQYLKYLAARFARIYPLHIFILLSLFFLELISVVYFQFISTNGGSHAPFTSSESIPTFFVNLFMLQTFINGTYWNQPAWSISAEWFVYIFLPFLLPIIYRLKWSGKSSLIIINVLILFLIERVFGTLDLTPTISLSRCVCEATVGIILFDIYKNNYLQKILSRNIATNLLFTASFITLFFEISHLVTIAIFTLLILSAAYNQNSSILSSKFLIFLGTISYSIYMTHWLIQSVLQKFSKLYTGNEFTTNFSLALSPVVLMICIIIVIITSAVTYKIIENPFRLWIKSKTW